MKTLPHGASGSEDVSAATETVLRIVLETARDGILTIDVHGKIASANRRAAALFRSEPGSLVGIGWRGLLDASSDAIPAVGLVHAVVARRCDGSTFPAECTFTEVDAALTIAVIHDDTERTLLEKQVLDVSEQVQRQIGQDLHDGLGQLLTGTAFLAKGLETQVADADRPQAQRVVELINRAIARVRNLARGLSPITVEEQDLESLLRLVVVESSQVLDVECVLELRDRVETHRPATITELCLITREAITNAVRHGKASRIVVSVARQGSRCLLSIEDDGIGIAESDRPVEGLGLRSMRQRAKMIGGSLHVERAAVGTIVRCWWSDG